MLLVFKNFSVSVIFYSYVFKVIKFVLIRLISSKLSIMTCKDLLDRKCFDSNFKYKDKE